VTTGEHLLKYGRPNTAFDGLSWVAYIGGKSYTSAEDPHEGEALDALLEHIEQRMWALSIFIGNRKIAEARKL